MAAVDQFAERYSDPGKFGSMDWPHIDGEAITPSNTVEFTNASRAIYVGGAGTVVVITLKGTSLTFVGVPAGAILPVRAKRVHLTGTTATNMLALY